MWWWASQTPTEVHNCARVRPIIFPPLSQHYAMFGYWIWFLDIFCSLLLCSLSLTYELDSLQKWTATALLWARAFFFRRLIGIVSEVIDLWNWAQLSNASNFERNYVSFIFRLLCNAPTQCAIRSLSSFACCLYCCCLADILFLCWNIEKESKSKVVQTRKHKV